MIIICGSRLGTPVPSLLPHDTAKFNPATTTHTPLTSQAQPTTTSHNHTIIPEQKSP